MSRMQWNCSRWLVALFFPSLIHVTNLKNEAESQTDVLCIFLILQSVPIGLPHAVSANLEKLDLNRLKEDIPKFRSWILSSSAAVWNTFMAKNLEEYLSTCESGDEWIMQVSQREHPPRSESTSSRKDNPELAAMFAAERKSCQVRNLYGAFKSTLLRLLHSQSYYGWLILVRCASYF